MVVKTGASQKGVGDDGEQEGVSANNRQHNENADNREHEQGERDQEPETHYASPDSESADNCRSVTAPWRPSIGSSGSLPTGRTSPARFDCMLGSLFRFGGHGKTRRRWKISVWKRVGWRRQRLA